MSSFNTDRVVKHVLLIIAMEAEAKHLMEDLKLNKVEATTANCPAMYHTGMYKDCLVSVVTNGKCKTTGVDLVGTNGATLAAFCAINDLKPDLVINAGTAGGFRSKGATIGDPFLATGLMHHDRRIPIPGFTEYGIGNHVALSTPNLAKDLGFKSGVVTTGNSLDHTEMDDQMMLNNDASVKDMEGAAIAWVAELSNTPFMALKVVTDIVDGERPTHEEFLENLSAAAKSLNEVLPRIIDYVVGKPIGQL